jgi:hypothetical protein
MALCPRGSQEMKAKHPIAIGEVRRMSNRSKEWHASVVGQSIHPGSFLLDSVESRAAARALGESREPSTYHCITCVLTGLMVMGSGQPDFTPNESLEKGPDGRVYKCAKHKDRSREATVQALIKSGLLGGPTP